MRRRSVLTKPEIERGWSSGRGSCSFVSFRGWSFRLRRHRFKGLTRASILSPSTHLCHPST